MLFDDRCNHRWYREQRAFVRQIFTDNFFENSLAPIQAEILTMRLRTRLRKALPFAAIVIVALAVTLSFWLLRPDLVQKSVQAMIAWVPGWLISAWADLINLVKNNLAVTGIGGIIVAFLSRFFARRDRILQRRRVYMDLEFESARIFGTCIDRPEIIGYLEGSLASPSSPEERDLAPERAYWYVCQVLNTFELMISLYQEKVVTIDIFSTWVSWFHEVGTYKRFFDFWDTRALSFHYKKELQDVMDTAMKLRDNPDREKADFNSDAELASFHKSVSVIFDDDEIEEHYLKSRKAKDERSKNTTNSPVPSLSGT